ncbi:phosphatidylserine decarboxylase [Porphyromonadaceae bacterium COT-184 OH4590]|nr:phosphatidylserine decarboxylase [Porphyromonadaceae bacterium COT-184 OH4590]
MRIHREGRVILISMFILLVVINIIFHFKNPLGVTFIINLAVSIATFGFFLYFFRNPERIVEIDDDSLVIAPADGRIVTIEEVEEYEYFEGEKLKQVSIFMSPFNVHANWYPINGSVLYAKHHSGRHKAAYLPKSSHENERSTIVIESKTGKKILVRQIAGALARRIVTYAAPNHASQLNHHLGFIKFGSRVDIFLPLEAEVFVTLAERTRGNETIIARLPD